MVILMGTSPMEFPQKTPSEETQTAVSSQKRPLGAAVLIALVFLLPLFFVPYSATSTSFAKTALLSLGILGVLALLLFRELKSGVLSFPASLTMLAGLLVPLAYTVSALAAPSFRLSFFGQGFEIDTVFTVSLVFLLFLLTALSCRSKGNAVYMFVALVASFALLVLFHATRFFAGPDILSFGIFTSDISSPIGKWNDLGIFSGLILLLASLSLDRLSVRGAFAGVLWAVCVLAILFLAVVNFMLVWLTLGFIAAALLASVFFYRRLNFLHSEKNAVEGARRIPFATIAVGIVSLVFIADAYVPQLIGKDQPPIGTTLFTVFGFSQLEARPSWATTYAVGKDVYRESFLLGSGPNTFTEDWLLYKPPTINQTIFWNTPFSLGVGFIPTAFISVGAIGALAWLFFFFSFFYSGIRALRKKISDTLLGFLALAAFLVASYLWFFAIFYTPNLSLLALAAMFSGVSVAVLAQAGILKQHTLTLALRPRLGFIISLALILLLMVGVVSAYTIGRKFFSSFYFGRATAAVNAQDLDAANAAVEKALRFSTNDRYHQLSAQVAVSRIGAVLGENPEPNEEVRENLRSFAEQAIGGSIAATNYNSRNYYNWLVLGRVYEALARLGTTNAYENALAAYTKALEFNPHTPEIPLARARLEAIRGEFGKAREEIAQALVQKSDYTAAILLLAQIEISTGNTDRAISSLSAAAVVPPVNPVILFQLGFLEYSVKDYVAAIKALEEAVSLADDYSNARYFLGLAYYYNERPGDAIIQFERVAELNPDNGEVNGILENLKNGKDPLTGTLPPTPEKRPTPPFDD